MYIQIIQPPTITPQLALSSDVFSRYQGLVQATDFMKQAVSVGFLFFFVFVTVYILKLLKCLFYMVLL